MEETPDKITYESLWKAIIRPPRDYYKEEELGPTSFIQNGRTYTRKDFEIVDFQGKLLKLSFIEPDIKDRPNDIMPCVIYLHANSSSRVEGINMKRYLLKNNINICAFDFEGSGYSEGEYISLGYHEKHQVKNVVDFVEKYPGVGEIGLWGRSMGAATTLIYASMDQRIKAIVVDSPFSDFRRVAKEMCLAQISIPGFLIDGAISIIGKSVYKKNGMKINEIKAIEAVRKCDIPVIFIHARDDDIVKFQHTLDLFNNYAGKNKKIKDCNGGHNGKRPTTLMEQVGNFFLKYLGNEEIEDNDIINNNEENFFKTSTFTASQINIDFENYNFDLNQRRKKTIYEEFGIQNISKNLNNNLKPKESENIIIENKQNKLEKEKNEKEKEDKIINKKLNVTGNMIINNKQNLVEKEKKENENKILNKKLNEAGNIIIDNKQNIDAKEIIENEDKNHNDIKNSENKINNNSYKKEEISNNINKNYLNYKSNIYSIYNNINNDELDLNFEENNLANSPQIKRKTIYDDLNIRK